jgi:broad specificity phosphatase PhoE
MKREHAAMRRRPLLTPIWLSALVGVLVIAVLGSFWSSMTTTTVVIVRHAEKELGTIEDPPLSQAGEQRAAALARLLGDRNGPGHVAAVFASDTRRSQRTAAPLAEAAGLVVTVMPAADVEGLVRRVRSDYRGRNVVIVSHSNRIPELVKRFSGREVPPIADQDYGTMYVVTIPTLGRPSVLRLDY